MIECLCEKCGNKWILHNPSATCDICPYCGHPGIKKRQIEPRAHTATTGEHAGDGSQRASSCPKCGRAIGKDATHCIYCGTDPSTGKPWGAAPTDETWHVQNPQAAAGPPQQVSVFQGQAAAEAPPLPSAGRPAMGFNRPYAAGPTDTGGSGWFKALLALLLIGGVVLAVWYFTRWHPNFTLALQPRTGQPNGQSVDLVYRLKKNDLVRTSSHLDMKVKMVAEGRTQNLSNSLDYQQFTRVIDVLPSGDYHVRCTAKFVDGSSSGGLDFDMATARRAIDQLAAEAELDPHGWIRPGTLVDLSETTIAGDLNTGMILRALPRVPMAPGQVVEAHQVFPLPDKPLQELARFVGNRPPSLTGDCLFKGIEERNGKRLAHLSLQILLVWEGEGRVCRMPVRFKGGVLWTGSCFYDVQASIVSEVYLNGKIELFARADDQGDVAITGTVDYYDFSDLNPADD